MFSAELGHIALTRTFVRVIREIAGEIVEKWEKKVRKIAGEHSCLTS